MSINRALFSKASDEWRTPSDLYKALDAEFKFQFDPCPMDENRNGLLVEWKSPAYVNPPYSDVLAWIEKAYLEFKAGKTIVMLLPARTCTKWFHEYALKATELRFIRGRLKFGDAKHPAPFPSVLVIFKP